MTRATVVLAGPASWAREQAAARLPADGRVRWIGEAVPEGAPESVQALPPSGFRKVLGTTVDVLVYDAHSGLDADALGAAAGSVRGGGLLVLLTPPWAEWRAERDPLLERLIPAGRERAEAGGRFLARLCGILAAEPSVACYTPADGAPALTPGPPPALGGDHGYGCCTADQRAAVEAVLHVVTGHRRRPAVLTADRGRGKSAALGLAVGELLRTRRIRRAIVVAPTMHAAEPVLAHAAERSGGRVEERRRVRGAGGQVRYVEPEQWLERPETGDLVVVDEAAGLPVGLLTELLTAAPRIAFATTVHGYEGSGRGFDLRFRAVLDDQTPQWRAVALETPIRWSLDDPLEAWLARLLCLDAEPAEVGEATESGPPPRIRPVAQDELAADERRLREAFGLLVAAHYRTRPFDLHQLLDAPGRHLFVAERDGQVLGVVSAAEEGGLDAETAHEVWAERRRPHGHLLPQALATHAGIEAAPTGHALRIQRIAVHPALRRQGVGARLVAAVADRARWQRLSLLGTSFGATPELIAFWRACGLWTVALGARRDRASGEHSALMARGLDAAGISWVAEAGARLGEGLPDLLGEPMARLEPRVALAAVRASQALPPPGLTAWQRRELAGFVHGRRGYAAALPALRAVAVGLLTGAIRSEGRMAEHEAAFIGKVLQRRGWAETARRLSVSGRRQAMARLREALGDLSLAE